MFDQFSPAGSGESRKRPLLSNAKTAGDVARRISPLMPSPDPFEECGLRRSGNAVAVSIPLSVYKCWSPALRIIVDESAFAHFSFDDGALTLTFTSQAWDAVVDLSRLAGYGQVDVGGGFEDYRDLSGVIDLSKRHPHPLAGPAMIGPFIELDDDEDAADILKGLGFDDDQAGDGKGVARGEA